MRELEEYFAELSEPLEILKNWKSRSTEVLTQRTALRKTSKR